MKTKTLNDGRVFPIELPTVGNQEVFAAAKLSGIPEWFKELLKAEGAPMTAACRVWEEGSNGIDDLGEQFSLENRCKLAPSVEVHPIAWISIFDSVKDEECVGGTLACAGTCRNGDHHWGDIADWQAADVGACAVLFFDRITGKYIDSIG